MIKWLIVIAALASIAGFIGLWTLAGPAVAFVCLSCWTAQALVTYIQYRFIGRRP